MAFNAILGREPVSAIDGGVSPSGLIWDDVAKQWRGGDGQIASPQQVAGSRFGDQQDAGPSGLEAGALALGVGAASKLLPTLGKKGVDLLKGAFTGGPATPELLSAARIPSAADAVGQALATSPATPNVLSAAKIPSQVSTSAVAPQAPGALAQGLNIAGGVAGAAGIADLLASSQRGNTLGSTLQGAASGAGLGNVLPGVGTILGAGLGGALGLAKSFEGGKNEDQVSRDSVRGALQQSGLLDENFGLTLADGSKFNLGLDGRAEFDSFDGSKKIRFGYEADDTNPLTPTAIGFVNPLAELITGGDDKLRSDFASQFSNAITSNANTLEDVRQNAKALYSQVGITEENAVDKLRQLQQSGKVTEDQLSAFANGLRVVFRPEGVDREVFDPTQSVEVTPFAQRTTQRFDAPQAAQIAEALAG